MTATAPEPAGALPFSAPADRNRHPIGERLLALLPADARVLEVASGTGQHARHMALLHPGWTWQPTEPDTRLLPAIDARCRGLAGVRPALRLDVCEPTWPAAADGPWTALYASNLLHISPWAATLALLAGAAARLPAGGLLVVYGPFHVDGEPTVPSNQAFDADLQARNPAWGLRRLQAVQAEAAAVGLHLQAAEAMPANNRLLVLRRA